MSVCLLVFFLFVLLVVLCCDGWLESPVLLDVWMNLFVSNALPVRVIFGVL